MLKVKTSCFLFVFHALSCIICLTVVISAVEFLRNAKQGKYDAIIVDSSDPVGKLIELLQIGGSKEMVQLCNLHR